MTKPKNESTAPTPPEPVDWTGTRAQRVEYPPATTIFAQGDPATSVMYVEQGTVRLSVLSHAGKEAVVAVLDVAHFFGEGCLAGQSQRMATATAMTTCTIVVVDKPEMVRQLHAKPAFAGSFPDSYADAEHPDRRRPHRPAVQLQRKTAGTHVVAAGALW